MIEDVHQRDQAAVAPADDADALRVYVGMILEHPLLAGKHVVNLQSTIIDQPPELPAVAGAPAIVGRYYGVALLDNLSHDVNRARFEISMNPAVHVHKKR